MFYVLSEKLDTPPPKVDFERKEFLQLGKTEYRFVKERLKTPKVQFQRQIQTRGTEIF